MTILFGGFVLWALAKAFADADMWRAIYGDTALISLRVRNWHTLSLLEDVGAAIAGAWEFPPQFSFYSVRNNGNGGLLVSTIERPEHAHIKEMAVEAVRAMGEQ